MSYSNMTPICIFGLLPLRICCCNKESGFEVLALLVGRANVNDVIHQCHQHAAAGKVAEDDRDEVARDIAHLQRRAEQ